MFGKQFKQDLQRYKNIYDSKLETTPIIETKVVDTNKGNIVPITYNKSVICYHCGASTLAGSKCSYCGSINNVDLKEFTDQTVKKVVGHTQFFVRLTEEDNDFLLRFRRTVTKRCEAIILQIESIQFKNLRKGYTNDYILDLYYDDYANQIQNILYKCEMGE